MPSRSVSRGALVLAVGAAVTAALYLLNVTRAPDFSMDEVLYATAGQNVISNDALTWGKDPILVHPPVYFLGAGFWLWLVGEADAGPIAAVHATRWFNGLLNVALVVAVGLAARSWFAAQPARRRTWIVIAAMALAALNGFLLRFGRIALIEPLAMLLAVVTLLVAWRLRHASAPVYVSMVGAVGGVALLTKMPIVFLVSAPLVAALMRRELRAAARSAGALLVAGAVWLCFPLWATLNGWGGTFADQQTLSIRRLLGLVQLTGLNQEGAAAESAFTDTLFQYANGYLVFAVGAACLAVGCLRMLVDRRSLDEGSALVLGLGVTSYAFLCYSVLFGQSNEHLSVYTVPASSLLAAGAVVFLDLPGRLKALARLAGHGAVVACVGAVAVGAVAWVDIYLQRDDAVARAGAFVTAQLPDCAPVNATGDTNKWRPVLPQNPVTSYASGPQALADGVRIFLLSPKDVKFRYGDSNPELAAWIEQNGRQVLTLDSHTYQQVSVWVVGDPVAPIGLTVDECVPAPVQPGDEASATLFGGLLVGALALTAGAGALAERRGRARRLGRPGDRTA